MRSYTKQRGLSLVQTLLAFVIGVLIFVMGYRLYLTYKRDADILAVVANVDALAQAATLYYYAQCYGTTNSSGVTVPGTLNPAVATSTMASVNITTDLINAGYLASGAIRPNALVDNTVGTNGYVVEFHKGTAYRTANGVTTGTIVEWAINVGVKIKNQSIITQIKDMTQASCTTTAYNTGGYYSVWPCADVAANRAYCDSTYGSSLIGVQAMRTYLGCSVTNSPSDYGTYLLYERAPSAASSKAQSDLWLTNPVVNQFTQQYRTNSSGTNQYYLCGS